MLKFEFPFALEEPVVTAEAAYAVVSRQCDGRESPCQKWVDITGTTLSGAVYGVGLVNDSKYGYDAEGSTLRLTALRSPIYAFHEPRRVEPGKLYRYMDQGLHEFRFALVPHEGDWRDAGLPAVASLFNAPPVAVETHLHSGGLPEQASLGDVSEANVHVCALKKCEDDEGLIVRLWETLGRSSECTLRLGEHKWQVGIGPFEIKTLKITGDVMQEVDLIERPIKAE